MSERNNGPESVELRFNPHYGGGVFRRRVRLTNRDGAVDGELEDCSHGFRVTVFHDGVTVTSIEPEVLRVPLTTCPGAVRPIHALVGQPLKATTHELMAAANPRANCTHLLDLTIWAIAQATRAQTQRQYDVEVTDETDDGADMRVYRNDELVHHWRGRQLVLEAPAEFAGNSLFKGFGHWANEAFEGEEREAAFILQKGCFVAQARRYDMSAFAGESVAGNSAMLGVCYSYSPGIVEYAYGTSDSVRDFTDTPEQLLRFV